VSSEALVNGAQRSISLAKSLEEGLAAYPDEEVAAAKNPLVRECLPFLGICLDAAAEDCSMR